MKNLVLGLSVAAVGIGYLYLYLTGCKPASKYVRYTTDNIDAEMDALMNHPALNGSMVDLCKSIDPDSIKRTEKIIGVTK